MLGLIMIFGALFSVIGFSGIFTPTENSSTTLDVIFAIIGVLLILFGLKANKERKINVAKEKELIKQGMVAHLFINHISGLSVSERILCEIIAKKDDYTFIASNITSSLKREKVIDIAMKSETEVQQQYVSSVGGAVLGGTLLGAAGAAYGGRAKKKEVRTTTTYLVFTYKGETDTDIKHLIFEATYNKEIKKLIEDFEAKKKVENAVNIEL